MDFIKDQVGQDIIVKVAKEKAGECRLWVLGCGGGGGSMVLSLRGSAAGFIRITSGLHLDSVIRMKTT